jgi:Flp pilus assembly protein TadD
MTTARSRLAMTVVGLTLLASLAACGNDDGTPAASTTTSSSSTQEPSMTGAGVEQMAASVVGMSEDDAVKAIKDAGYTSRVVERDGEKFAVTMDLQPDRINLTIRDDTVTKATVG